MNFARSSTGGSSRLACRRVRALERGGCGCRFGGGFVEFALGTGAVGRGGRTLHRVAAGGNSRRKIARARQRLRGQSLSLGAMLGAPVLDGQSRSWRAPHARRLGVFVLAAWAIAAALFRATDIRMLDASSTESGRRLGRTFYLLTQCFPCGGRGPHGVEPSRCHRSGYGGAAALAVGATTFITGAVGAARIAGGGWSIISRRRA